ncbi:hypothetical protein T484DRAFT_1862065 [Baffinella frigidus]|nr:hypothetical protein T484DRAFT_1862065 [Cryptophyta sp. CCMP2293]
MVKQSKEATAAQKARWWQANRAEIAAKRKLYRAKNAETIKENAALYRAKNAEKSAAYKALYHRANRAELAAKQTLYRQANRAKLAAKQKLYRAKNAVSVNIYMARYRKLYRAKNADLHAIRNKQRYHTDPVYAASCRLRGRLIHCLRTRGAKKLAPTKALLGCSWQEAVDHLESNDRGFKILDPGIEIDHIRPMSSFGDLACLTQQSLVNHWSNLQLLPMTENRQKGADFNYDAWSITDAGRILLALECELRAAAANAAVSGGLRETDDDDDEDDDDEDSDDDDDSGE